MGLVVPGPSHTMTLNTANLVLLFMPWAFVVTLGHATKQQFRAHLRRRHPQAYQHIYGAYADRRRHSALDPIAWLLQLRFEMSSAWRGFGDSQLDRLGTRMRRRMLGAVVLYFSAVAWLLAGANSFAI
jgi:hypothetical protein